MVQEKKIKMQDLGIRSRGREIQFSKKKKKKERERERRNPTICSNMDGTRGQTAK